MSDVELLPKWVAIPGLPGYEVSDFGDVRSWRSPRHGQRLKAPKRISTRQRKGYVRCMLRDKGWNRGFSVHRLVLLAFVGPPPSACETSHENGDSLDNRLLNLRWRTKRENEERKTVHGTSATGSRGMRRKLTAAAVIRIRAQRLAGQSFASIGREHGVRPQTIQAIIGGKSWKHV